MRIRLYKKIIFLLACMYCSLNLYAQNAQVTGTVKSTKGEPLVGVTVKIKGGNLGTATNANGEYSINAGPQAVLQATYIGYIAQEAAVGTKKTVDFVLESTQQQLGEVVVTALGIKREVKKLGYSATSVNTDQLAVNRTTNVGNSLEGKVAGLNVTPPAGGPGGSTKIRVRGQSSFSGDNSPLIVVNGTPINNTSVSGGGNQGYGGNVTGGSSDQGDGLQSINQDDIESMTVLKGGAAAALYGSRAKDGAIIITTKSGAKNQGIGIELNSNFQADQALDYTDFQYQYGQGEFGKRQVTLADAQSSGVYSFGEKFDGAPAIQFDGSTHPYSPFKDRIKQFYRTGTSFSNSIALSGGNDKGNFRLSFDNTDANGIMPNSDYHKKIFNIGLNYNFTPQLSAQINANYSNEFNHNPPQIGIQDMNANTTIYTLANSINPEWLKNDKDANGDEMPLSRFTNRNNPYWVTMQRFENVHRDRLFGTISVKYQFTDWLYLQARIGQDYYTRPYNYDRPTGTRSIGAATTGFNGYYYQDVSTFRERNMDFLIGAKKKFGDFAFDVTLGGNEMQQTNDRLSTSVTNFYVRDLYTIGNGQTKSPGYSYGQKRTNSFYGMAEISFKNYLYLTATARNDWFSTLNINSDSYLYPSASLGFVFSELMGQSTPSWLEFGKLRLAYSQVGSDASPYQSNLYYSLNANTFNGSALGGISGGTNPNPNLKPLSIKEIEAGLDLRMFKGRVNLDVAVYKKNTDNEILNVDISSASGFNQSVVNVGRLENKGVEMLLNLVPVKTVAFTWETTFNGAYNISKVISLANGQTKLDAGNGEFFGTVSYEVGKPLASLRGYDYKRDGQGRIILINGLPQVGNLTTFGSAIPKWTGGWTNSFRYKGIRLTAQVDFKAGAKLLSGSNLNFLREGLSKPSLVGREGGVVFPGVNPDGSPNTTAVEAETFYTAYRSTNIATPFVYDASFVRLRSLSLGYDFTRFIKVRAIKGLNVSLIANNVLMIKKFVDNLDPEASVSASDNLQGIEAHTLPTTRSFGLNLNIKL